MLRSFANAASVSWPQASDLQQMDCWLMSNYPIVGFAPRCHNSGCSCGSRTAASACSCFRYPFAFVGGRGCWCCFGSCCSSRIVRSKRLCHCQGRMVVGMSCCFELSFAYTERTRLVFCLWSHSKIEQCSATSRTQVPAPFPCSKALTLASAPSSAPSPSGCSPANSDNPTRPNSDSPWSFHTAAVVDLRIPSACFGSISKFHRSPPEAWLLFPGRWWLSSGFQCSTRLLALSRCCLCFGVGWFGLVIAGLWSRISWRFRWAFVWISGGRRRWVGWSPSVAGDSWIHRRFGLAFLWGPLLILCRWLAIEKLAWRIGVWTCLRCFGSDPWVCFGCLWKSSDLMKVWFLTISQWVDLMNFA